MLKGIVKNILNGIAAGILIALGGSIFLACENKIVGSFLFSVALMSICYLGYSLYTGKICYMPLKHDKDAFSVLLLGLLGNVIGTTICGYLIRYALPKLGETAETICQTKLTQTFPETLIRGFFCGLLIYLAVEIYKKKNTMLGVFICIPVFILSGFEHSIADMFYFAASGIVSLEAFGFIWVVILGNTIGGMLLPVMTNDWGKKE